MTAQAASIIHRSNEGPNILKEEAPPCVGHRDDPVWERPDQEIASGNETLGRNPFETTADRPVFCNCCNVKKQLSQ
jgi:hypothetical protein